MLHLFITKITRNEFTNVQFKKTTQWKSILHKPLCSNNETMHDITVC